MPLAGFTASGVGSDGSASSASPRAMAVG
jgi:hypothetical protein